MTKEQIDIEYEILVNRSYELYKKDWCAVRGWSYDEVCKADNEDMEYNGQMFVCKDEFENCEFSDEDYMRYLLNKEDFWCYQKIMDYIQ